MKKSIKLGVVAAALMTVAGFAVAQTKDIKVVEEGQREMEQALGEMTPEDRRRMEEILKLRPPKGD